MCTGLCETKRKREEKNKRKERRKRKQRKEQKTREEGEGYRRGERGLKRNNATRVHTEDWYKVLFTT